MKIIMMTRWNVPCGVSMHAELLGRAFIEMGYNLKILAPVEYESPPTDKDEDYVLRCYRLPKGKPDYFFDNKPFLKDDYDVFIVQNLELMPMDDLLKIYPKIKKRAKTVLVIHEGKAPGNPVFYKFDWDAIVCFDNRYKEFLRKIYPEDKIHIITYPCYPLKTGNKKQARLKLNLPLDKKIIFNYGVGIYRHLHLLPSIEEVNQKYPLVFLTVTHIQKWYDVFEATKSKYTFIDLRKQELTFDELYTYLHASDCLLVHKDSAEAVVLSSTVYFCLGALRPILVHRVNFFDDFHKEVLKYSNVKNALNYVFENKDNVKPILKSAKKFVQDNSSFKIVEKFINLFKLIK